YDVAELLGVQLGIEAKAIRDLAIRRIPQNDASPADQYGDVRNRKFEMVEEVLSAFVVIRIEEGVWMEIPRQKLLDANCVRRMIGSDEQHVSAPALEELRPAEEKCAHDHFAQLRIGLHQRDELLPLHLDDL